MYIFWLRDGNFDNILGLWFEFNYFVFLISEKEEVIICFKKYEIRDCIGQKLKKISDVFIFFYCGKVCC